MLAFYLMSCEFSYMSANYPYNVESNYGPVPIVSTEDAAKLAAAAHGSGGDAQNISNDPQGGGMQHSQQQQQQPPPPQTHPSQHPSHPSHPSSIIKEERSKDLQDGNPRSTSQHVSTFPHIFPFL